AMMPIFWDVTIKVSVMISVALTTTWLLRRQSAALRHLILSAAMVFALVTPLLTMMLPELNVGRLVVAPEQAAPPQILSSDRTTADPDVAVLVRVAVPAARDFITPVWLAGVALGAGALITGWIRLSRIARRSRRVSDGVWVRVSQVIAQDY